MGEAERTLAGQRQRTPARVLARLTADTLRVILCPGEGLADGGIEVEIPLALVPLDLRMPNSEFDVVLDAGDWSRTRVVRKAEVDPEAEP